MAANGVLEFLPMGVVLPDGTTNNASARMQKSKSTATSSSSTSVPFFAELLFDPSTAQHAFWAGEMGSNFVGTGTCITVRIKWKANATSGNVVWNAQFGAITPGDVDTPNEHAFASAQAATTAVNATEARRLIETQITFTAAQADNISASDWFVFCLRRDAANASDTCSVDAEVTSVTVEYT